MTSELTPPKIFAIMDCISEVVALETEESESGVETAELFDALLSLLVIIPLYQSSESVSLVYEDTYDSTTTGAAANK